MGDTPTVTEAAAAPPVTAEADASTAKATAVPEAVLNPDTSSTEETTGQLTTAADVRTDLHLSEDNYQLRERVFVEGEFNKWEWDAYTRAQLIAYHKWWTDDDQNKNSFIPLEAFLGARKGFVNAQGVEKWFLDVKAGQFFGRSPFQLGPLTGLSFTLGGASFPSLTVYIGLVPNITWEDGVPKYRLRLLGDGDEHGGGVLGSFLSSRTDDGTVKGAFGVECNEFEEDCTASVAVAAKPRLSRNLMFSAMVERTLLRAGYKVEGDVQYEIVDDILTLMLKGKRSDRPPFFRFFRNQDQSNFIENRAELEGQYKPTKKILIIPVVSLGDYYLAGKLGLDFPWFGLSLTHLLDHKNEPEGHTSTGELYGKISLFNGALHLQPELSVRNAINSALFGDQMDAGGALRAILQLPGLPGLILVVEGAYVRHIVGGPGIGDSNVPNAFDEIELYTGDPSVPGSRPSGNYANPNDVRAMASIRWVFGTKGNERRVCISSPSRYARFLSVIRRKQPEDATEYNHDEHEWYFEQKFFIEANGGREVDCKDCHSGGNFFVVTEIVQRNVCDKCHAKWVEKQTAAEGKVLDPEKFPSHEKKLFEIDKKEGEEEEEGEEGEEQVTLADKLAGILGEGVSICTGCHSYDKFFVPVPLTAGGSFVEDSVIKQACSSCHLWKVQEGLGLSEDELALIYGTTSPIGNAFDDSRLVYDSEDKKHPIEVRGPNGSTDPATFPKCEACHQREVEETLEQMLIAASSRKHLGSAGIIASYKCEDCHAENVLEILISGQPYPVAIVKTPHPLPWVDFHAGQARADREYCFLCHKGDVASPVEGHEGLAIPTCDSCHKGDYTIIGSPHSLSFRFGHIHGPEGERNGSDCITCHRISIGNDGYGFCRGCHKERGIEPLDLYHRGVVNWMSVDRRALDLMHAFIAGRTGGLNCGSCHIPLDFQVYYQREETCQNPGCHGERKKENILAGER